ncbi:hypothetical protein [Massilia sp. Mn16-1_5]|uniref:hypothetical protein n=1 Tax=Massilia sp. Mn16-1_5 TaxID=2079199 RepID=UPI00109E730E|nr:hypothetical protein [Massilia sp. Mn16-1_5]
MASFMAEPASCWTTPSSASAADGFDAGRVRQKAPPGLKRKKPLILSNQRLPEFWLRGQDLNL